MSDERMNMEKPREHDLEPACSSLGLCSTCRKIFDAPRIPHYPERMEFEHHTSQEDLLEAAEQRCYICRLLRDELTSSAFQARSPTESGSAMPLWFCCIVQGYLTLVNLNFYCRYVGGSSIELLKFTVCGLEDCKQLATDRPGQTTWSAALKERARQWLRDESAEETVLNPKKFLPKRLLHVRALENDQHQVSLCADHTLPRKTQYLTLSHRWGQNDFLRLMQSNIEEFKQCIQYQSLPKTFRDAIKITCDLDYNYLWIDSLCIIQDSTEDWLSQGLTMDQIYQNAACNISADAAHDSEAGLIKTRDIETFLPLQVDVAWRNQLTERDSLQRYVFVHETWHEAVSGAPLAIRAWVFQERLLSQEIIHFTARQVFFESKDRRKGVHNFSEQWPKGVPPYHLRINGSTADIIVIWWHQMTGAERQSEAIWKTWTNIVGNYSQMRLTYDTDRLAALSGVIKEVQRNTGDEYLAGLWKKDLLWQLLWHINPTRSSHRTQHYTAPTWSWASVNTPVFNRLIPWDYKSKLRLLCKFVSAEISPILNQDNTGAIKGGFLRLQGSLRQARLTQGDPKSKAQPYWTIGRSRKKIIFLPDTVTPDDLKVPDHDILDLGNVFQGRYGQIDIDFYRLTITVHAPTQSVFLLPIFSASREGYFATVGLALIPTDLVRGEFQRGGLFLTLHRSGVENILHHSCDIEESYYEKKNRGRYTISIV